MGKQLIKKAIKTYKEFGAKALTKKVAEYLNREKQSGTNAKNVLGDVLFINGCYLPHPSRYRVTHQREQLWAANISSDEVFYTDLTMDMVRLYRVFIFFRCPYTDQIGEFVKVAKTINKKVVYDIDDLMIDRSYTESIKYLNTMREDELKQYYEGIDMNQKLLKLCDAAITTTERMAIELKKYVPEVYINRNVASEEMLALSEKANKEKTVKLDKVVLGYFSGSITHNADFELILPAIVNVMEKYSNVLLQTVGDLEIPKELEKYKDRVVHTPFVDWKKLPELIASVDVNLAPLENSIFNEAKSENKWVEAALVRVPTIASNVGAFKHMVKDKETGVLCTTLEDWKRELQKLIEDVDYRNKLGNLAYEYCKKECTSVYTSNKIACIIQKIWAPNICFILPVLQISGGALVALKHCAMIQEAGYDVSLINQGYEKEKWVEKDGRKIPVINYHSVNIAQSFDKVVATLWTTVDFFRIYSRIKDCYYNVQNFETDFYKSGEKFKIEANRTYHMIKPIKYITISKWCQNWLKDDYNKESVYAPNGIYSERFYPQKREWKNRKIRILVEGNSDDYYKNVDESFRIIDLLDKNKYEIWFMSYQGKPKEGYYVDKFMHKVPYENVPDVYRQCDILIKSSILESFSYPPLEMMATGGYVVVAPNDGNIEYLENEYNCLFYQHNDLSSAVRAIERIENDQELRNNLYMNGVDTAKERDWENIRKEILNLYDIGDTAQ